MSAQAERIGPAALTRYAEIVHTGLVDMRGATAARLLLELLVSRMLLPVGEPVGSRSPAAPRTTRTPSPAAIAPATRPPRSPGSRRRPVFTRRSQQPTDRRAPPSRSRAGTRAGQASAAATAQPGPDSARSRRRTRSSAHRSAAAAPTPTPAPVPAVAQPAPAQPRSPPPPEPRPRSRSLHRPGGTLDATAVRRIWSELLAAVRATSRSTEAMLTNAMVSEVDGNVVTITHTSAPLARRLAESRNTEAIATALSTVLGGTWQVRCTHGTPGATAQQSTPAKAARPAPTRPSQAQHQQSRPQPEPQQSPAPRPPVDDVPPPAGAPGARRPAPAGTGRRRSDAGRGRPPGGSRHGDEVQAQDPKRSAPTPGRRTRRPPAEEGLALAPQRCWRARTLLASRMNRRS